MKERISSWALGATGFALVVGIWYVVVILSVFRPGLVPTPHEVLARMVEMFISDQLLLDVISSVQRVLVGVFVGVLAAIPVGFLLGWYRPMKFLLDPVINFFRALPPIALIPLVIVYFGIGEFARISVLTYASFFAAIVVLYEAIVAIDPIYVRAARAMGARDWEIFYRVVFPLSIPHILTAFRVALGVSWATLVAAELIAAQQGLGAVIQDAANFFQIPAVYAGIVLIGVTALIMDWIARAVIARFVLWQERVGQ